MKSTDNKDNSRSVIINSVDRTLDIIEYFFRKGTEVSITQISKDLNIYKSTVYRTLATLSARGYLTQDPASELYSLGPKMYALSEIETQDKDRSLIKTLMPYMKRLNEKYLDTVSLGVLRTGPDGMYLTPIIAGVESRLSLGVKFDINSQYEGYCSSLGKCLLAFSNGVDLSVYNSANMEKFTPNTISSPEELREALAVIRKNGYAMDDEEREAGLCCIGVPVLSNNHAIAAISLSGPTSRIRDEQFDEKIEYMKKLSEEITRDIFI